MHTLRDTATLAVLILLALTLRVNLDGKPVEWTVGTTAEAASEATVLPLAPPVEPETQHGAQPAGGQIRPLPLPPGSAAGEVRTFVWEFDGRRLTILVDTDEQDLIDAEEDSTHDTCGGPVRAHLSS